MSIADLRLYALERTDSLRALCELVASRHARGEGTVLLAGGTDWLVERESARVTAPGAALPLVIDIGRMDELRGVERVVSESGEVLRIGAATTYVELHRSGLVRARAPLLARMARDVGAIQIQARGTLGGNIATASPAADGVAALAAFDAGIVVQSVRGRRIVAVADLQTGYKTSTRAPDEVIVAVELALPGEDAAWTWRKVAARRAQAISKVSLAALAEASDGRVRRIGLGMGSVAPTTALLPSVRSLVASTPLALLDGEAVDAALDADICPIDDVRSTAVYRRYCARALVRGFLRALGAPC